MFLLEKLFAFRSDFGWHLRFGQIILAKGIVYKDLFSYTMPSYNFVDHEWLSDALFGFGFFYPLVGKFGLSIFFALYFYLLIIDLSKIVKNRWV